MKKSKKEAIGVATVSESEKTPISKKYEKPFIHTHERILQMNEPFRTICLAKEEAWAYEQKIKNKVPGFTKEAMSAIWPFTPAYNVRFNFSIGGVKFQSEPWILVENGITSRDRKPCSICHEKTKEIAECVWYYFDRNNVEKESYYLVCRNCLVESQAVFLTKAEWLNVVLSAAATDKVGYGELHNAKALKCALCDEHKTDSTWIHVEYKNVVLDVPVCDDHFDLMIYQPKDEVEFSPEAIAVGQKMKLGRHLQGLLNAHIRKDSTKFIKPVAKKVPYEDMTEEQAADEFNVKMGN